MPDIHLKLMRDLVEIRNAASSSGVENTASLTKKLRKWRLFAECGAMLMANLPI